MITNVPVQYLLAAHIYTLYIHISLYCYFAGFDRKDPHVYSNSKIVEYLQCSSQHCERKLSLISSYTIVAST